jgi:hypothetical protein
MSYPLRQPDPPAVYDALTFAGEVCLWIHGGFHPQVTTKEYGVQPAVRGTVLMLSGRTAGTAYDNVMVWRKGAAQFSAMDGGDVALCRIVKTGNGKGVTYEPGAGFDDAMAQQWIAANGDRLEQLRRDAVATYREELKRPENGPPPPPRQSTPPLDGGTKPLDADVPLPVEEPPF